MSDILLLMAIGVASLCIVCFAMVFVTLCCCVGRTKRSDGLTDLEWCCHRQTAGKQSGHILVENETDDEDIMYDEPRNDELSNIINNVTNADTAMAV